MPVILLPRLLFSLVSWLILAAAAYLIWSWAHGYDVVDLDGVVRHVRGPAWRLGVGLVLLAWSFLGRFVVLLFMGKGGDAPREQRSEGAVVAAPDGSRLHMESVGPTGGPVLILTHGWGLNSTAWGYAKEALRGRFRLVTWDLPGLGRSKPPADGKFTIDRFAQALGAVVQASGATRVVLVGHSIGGMTTQTFWRACPEALRARVAGLVLIDTTYENPIETMWLAPLWRALRWPVIEPLMWITVVLWPLAWLSAWQGYLSGMNQLVMRLTGFGRYATRGQVDFAARLAAKGSPAVQAKGNLAMFRWRVREDLPAIGVPVLVLAGTRDIVTLPEANRAIAEAVPNGKLAPMDGCGHMGFLERHADYNAAIAAFAAPLLEG